MKFLYTFLILILAISSIFAWSYYTKHSPLDFSGPPIKIVILSNNETYLVDLSKISKDKYGSISASAEKITSLTGMVLSNNLTNGEYNINGNILMKGDKKIYTFEFGEIMSFTWYNNDYIIGVKDHRFVAQNKPFFQYMNVIDIKKGINFGVFAIDPKKYNGRDEFLYIDKILGYFE